MRLSLLALLGLSLVSACDRTPPDDKDDTLPPGDDTDDTTPTDDTDDTTPGDDTDPSGDDTDLPDWTGPGTLTTVVRIRSGVGGHAEDELLAVRGLVVTSARSGKGFTAQQLDGAPWSGIYVYTGNQGVLPNVGDIVDVVGRYTEYRAPNAATDGTLAELEVGPNITDTSVTVVGTGGAPTIPEVDVATMASATTAEPYESLLVELVADCALNVATDPDDNFGEFHVDDGGAERVIIDQEYFSLPNNLTGFEVGSSFEGIVGTVYYSFDNHKVAPRTVADALGFSAAGATCDTDAPVDTDDSDVDTDLDSDVDTDLDSDVDTDVDTVDTGGDPCLAPWTGPGDLTTISAIRDGSGGHLVGDLVAIRCVVVTAARSNKGFTVQDPLSPTFGGLYVYKGNGGVTPAVGDLVTVVGGYQEFGTGNPAESLTQLRVDSHFANPTYPDSSTTVTGTAALPAPVALDVATLADPALSEPYESMLITLVDTCPLEIVSLPGGYQEIEVQLKGTPGATTWIDDEFFNFRAVAGGIAVGDTFSAVTGPMHFSFDLYKVAPRDNADVANYTPGGAPCP